MATKRGKAGAATATVAPSVPEAKVEQKGDAKRSMDTSAAEERTAASVKPQYGLGSSKKEPRLFIKSMELENFKSYAGKKTVGPFHKVHVNLNIVCLLHAIC